MGNGPQCSCCCVAAMKYTSGLRCEAGETTSKASGASEKRKCIVLGEGCQPPLIPVDFEVATLPL